MQQIVCDTIIVAVIGRTVWQCMGAVWCGNMRPVMCALMCALMCVKCTSQQCYSCYSCLHGLVRFT